MEKPARLSPREAKLKAIEVWNTGRLVKSDHAKRRMSQRRVTDPDIEYALLYGEISKPAEWDNENWEYTIYGTDVDGESLAIVFTFADENSTLVIITVKDW